MTVVRANLGSARVSRAGERVSRSRTFGGLLISQIAGVRRKDCFGATPKPTRGTRALPRSETCAAALFLHDLGVLDHGHAAALGHFSLQCDGLPTVLSQLIVDRLMFAYDQVCFAVGDDPDGTAALDALRPAGLAVLLADGVVIDVAHHVDHFARNFFRGGCITAVLVFLRDRQRRDRERSDEHRSDCNLHNCRFVVCRVKHEINLTCSARWSIVAASLCEARGLACRNFKAPPTGRRLQLFLDQIGELIEKVGGVMRPGRSFGMILHAEDRQFLVTHPFDGPVVQVDVGHFNLGGE